MPVAYQAGETRPKPKPKKKTPKRTTSAGGGNTGLPRGTVAAPTGPSSRLRPARVQPDGTISPRRRRSTRQLLAEYRRDHPGPMAMRTADTPWQAERRPRAPGYDPTAAPIVRVGGPTGAAVPRRAAGPAGQALIAGGYEGPTLAQLRQAAREPWNSTNTPVRKDPDGPVQSRRPRTVATLQLPTRPGAPGLRIPVVTDKPLSKADRPIISAVLRLAQQYLGVKYDWGSPLGRSLTGAISPEAAAAIGFDCSGLISYVYGRLGVSVFPQTQTMRHEGKHVDGPLKPGDAVFFGSDYGHVGLYLGNGKFIEAPYTGSVVRITDMSERSDFVEARRFVSDAGRIFQGA